MMRTTRIFILLLIALMMIGTASAAITYGSASDTITISSPDFNVSLSQLAALPATSPYVYTTGDGIWYITPTLSVTTGSIDFSGDDVTELRINAAKTKPISMATTVTSTRLADGMKIVSWDMAGDVPQPRTGDIEIYGIQSVSNLELQNLGRVLVRNVPNNTVYENVFFNQTVHVNYPVRFFGSSLISSAANKYAYNVTFINPRTSDLGLYVSAIDGLTIENVSVVYDQSVSSNTKALILDGCYNFTVSNSTIDACSSGVIMYGSHYGTLSNLVINGNWYQPGDATLEGLAETGTGIGFFNVGRITDPCSDILVDNVHTSNTGYSGISIKGGATRVTVYNSTFYNGYHNGFDQRADHVYAENVTVGGFDKYSDSQNWHISVANHSRYKDIVSNGTQIYVNTGENNTFENILFKNIHSYNGAGVEQILRIANLYDSRFINVTFQNTLEPIQYGSKMFSYVSANYDYDGCKNVSLIDTNLMQLSPTVAGVRFGNVGPAIMLNVNTTYEFQELDGYGTDYYEYWYPNIRVVNTVGQAVQDATITVNTTAKNGWGYNQTTFYTDNNGRLYDSGNRSNWLALPGKYANKTGIISTYAPEIIASKEGQSNSAVVSPDSTWYSSDVSSLSGPEIVLVLNVEGIPTPDPETPTFAVTTFIVSSFVAASLAVSSFQNRRRK